MNYIERLLFTPIRFVHHDNKIIMMFKTTLFLYFVYYLFEKEGNILNLLKILGIKI